MPNPWESFWELGEKYKGKVAILDDPRDALVDAAAPRTATPT